MASNYTRSFTDGGSLMQSGYTTRARKPVELLLVPMIDIFTVLVTFLLMTAVFSRITILQLDLPSSSSASPGTPPAFRLEVIVRQEGFELTNGTNLIATIPKVLRQAQDARGEYAYDFKALSQLALSLKQEHPDSDDASVLLEREVQYDYLIQAMDAVRTVEVTESEDGTQVVAAEDAKNTKKLALFEHVAVGEAP